MSRAFNFVAVMVVYIISGLIHYLSTELFNPDGVLYGIAANGTQAMNGAARAQFWFEILSVWVPLMAIGGITAWAVVKEFKRQTQTATGARPR